MKKMYDPEHSYDAKQRGYRLSRNGQECRNCRFRASYDTDEDTINFCRYSFDAVVGLAMTCNRWESKGGAA